MRIRKHAARKAGVVHDTVAFAHLDEYIVSRYGSKPGGDGSYIPRLWVKTEGSSAKVLVKVGGLVGFEGTSAQYRYWIELDIPELARIVRDVMRAAPSAELLESVVEGAAKALPRRRRRKKEANK